MPSLHILHPTPGKGQVSALRGTTLADGPDRWSIISQPGEPVVGAEALRRPLRQLLDTAMLYKRWYHIDLLVILLFQGSIPLAP